LEVVDAVPVLIDFGQAVDLNHPDSVILLQRDLDRIRTFFTKKGLDSNFLLEAQDALSFVVDAEERSMLDRLG